MDDKTKQAPVEITSWDSLVQYVEFLCRGSNKQMKICIIDEENEEIRIQTKDEFILNVEYAKEHDITSLTFVVYIDNKHIFNGIYQIKNPIKASPAFPVEKLHFLVNNVLKEKWYIPVKQDEALDLCIKSAIDLARDGKIDSNADCKTFIENVLPESFRKLQDTQSVLSWSREIQCGIFELLELLVDLVGVRLRYPPVPTTLLNILAMAFDTNTKFGQKHKKEPKPVQRVYELNDENILSDVQTEETFGWLRSIIERFLAQNGLKNVQLQFQYIDLSNLSKAATEYNALLKLFSKCQQCINAHRFRSLFLEQIRRAIEYFQFEEPSVTTTDEINHLKETLIVLCNNYELKKELNKLVRKEGLSQNSDSCDEPCLQISSIPVLKQRKTKHKDCYERLAEDMRSVTIQSQYDKEQSVKKQKTKEHKSTDGLSCNNLLECINEVVTSTNKRACKRRRRDKRNTLTLCNSDSMNKTESNHTNTTTTSLSTTYDRSNPDDILRYFGPMKVKVSNLYDNLQTAISQGKLREVLKIENKLKLLNPFSARFIADENMPDGTIMKPGRKFRKGWIVLNDGSLPWDNNDIQLMNLTNDIPVCQQPIIPVTAPHTRTVIYVDYIAPNEPGTYESKWILVYRQQTFGPMIWCSIEVKNESFADIKTELVSNINLLDDFELLDVPLPDCFNLRKPYKLESKTSSSISHRSSLTLSESQLTDLPSTSTSLINFDHHANLDSNDSDSISAFMSSPATPLPSPLIVLDTNKTITNERTSLIELPPPTENQSTMPSATEYSDSGRQSPRSKSPSDFVDTVVTNIFSVAKQAGSTAKAIFHTLQAIDEPISSASAQNEEQSFTLINTTKSNQTTPNHIFERLQQNSTKFLINSNFTDDPMQKLISMGFANRAKNQRLLKENANNLTKVIELLTIDNQEDTDWLRPKSILETYGLVNNENLPSQDATLNPPVRPRDERDRPRSIRLNPQEYFLIIVVVLALSALVIHNILKPYINIDYFS